MLDTNVFDRLNGDPEAISELENRRTLRLFVSEVQIAELQAIPETARRDRYIELANRLCVRVSAASSSTGPTPVGKHGADRLIAMAAAARCDLLVSDDAGLLERAHGSGLRAMDWASFASQIIFDRRE